MQTHWDRLEPVLTYARERLLEARSCAPAGQEFNNCFRDSLRALAACRDYLTLHRTPVYQTANPKELFEGRTLESVRPNIMTRVEPSPGCTFDSEQARVCVTRLIASAQLEADSRLWVELFCEENVPRIAVSMDGPGHVPDDVSFDGYIELPVEEFADRWTLATRGGRIDNTRNGVEFRLKGIRDTPAGVPDLEPLLDLVTRADKRLGIGQKWLGIASELPKDSKPTPDASAEEVEHAKEFLGEALGIIDGEPEKTKPADLTPILAEVELDFKQGLSKAGIEVETLCDAQVPPILMRRRRILTFFRSLFCWAQRALSDGGIVTALLEYDRPKRAAVMVITFAGPTTAFEGSIYEASLRRAVVEDHDGTLECARDAHGMTISATLTDSIGKELSEWIPGFDRFSEKSRQMLRLLKASDQTALEDVILNGVLEDELTRWLLPQLEQPIALHLARDMKPDNSGLPGASAKRLEKAMTQVQRGKPRKEICKPQYAGELLWAFRGDERHRKAVGVNRLGDTDVEVFCRALVQCQPDCLVALRLLAIILD